MATKSPYWFPARRYGWGWGMPLTWQGWAILVAFLGLLGAGFLFFPPKEAPGALLAYVTVLAGALIAICWFTGEPPRWRWGDGE